MMVDQNSFSLADQADVDFQRIIGGAGEAL
jgi:hypothetical protein